MMKKEKRKDDDGDEKILYLNEIKLEERKKENV